MNQKQQYKIAAEIAALAYAKLAENLGLVINADQQNEIEQAAIDCLRDYMDGEYNENGIRE